MVPSVQLLGCNHIQSVVPTAAESLLPSGRWEKTEPSCKHTELPKLWGLSPELGFHANVFLLEILKASCDFVKGGILATDFKFLSFKVFVYLVGYFETGSLYTATAILEHVIVGIHRGQKMLDLPDLWLQNVVSHPSRVLGTKLKSSAKAVLNYLSSPNTWNFLG